MKTSKEPELSVMMIVCNEEHHLINSMPFIRGIADELIIVVQESQDNTLKICRNWADKCFARPCLGISEPDKLFAWQNCSKDWVLHLDGDEVPSPYLIKHVKELMSDKNFDGYHLRRDKCIDGINRGPAGCPPRIGRREAIDFSTEALLLHGNAHFNTQNVKKIDDEVCLWHIKSTNDVQRSSVRFRQMMSEHPEKVHDNWYKKYGVSRTGFYTRETIHKRWDTFDISLCQEIAKIAKEMSLKNIIDFGCGKAALVKFLNERGFSCLGIDGYPKVSDFYQGLISYDLTNQLQLKSIDMYELGICLNVGHCIPEVSLDDFLLNICKLQKLIICWSKEYEGHVHSDLHINPKSNKELQSLFKRESFRLNAQYSSRLTQSVENKNKNIYEEILFFERE